MEGSTFLAIFAELITYWRMKKNNIAYRIVDLYYDGFRSMKLGKTLWCIIIVKLFIIFAILKVFFFPNILKERAEGNEASYVATQILNQ